MAKEQSKADAVSDLLTYPQVGDYIQHVDDPDAILRIVSEDDWKGWEITLCLINGQVPPRNVTWYTQKSTKWVCVSPPGVLRCP